SDLAIGIALIMGFRLARNFNFPYKARNLTDFWRRWHISLSTWLRDYVYIPLGGNRKGTFRTYANNFATMLVGGLWHGAAWKFVFWGAMHGAGLAVHKATASRLGRIGDSFPVRAFAWLTTMAFVACLWVFFRADSFSDSVTIISSVFSDFSPGYITAFASARMLWLILMAVIIIAHALPSAFWNRATDVFVRSPWIVKLLVFMAVVQLVLQLRSETVSPFIYFQF
ncbi:MAG: MBOAT family protein, partial [Muribaculaceae bacterium]|nr:MBOAT family protein [Muribaculaceae bacterium]